MASLLDKKLIDCVIKTAKPSNNGKPMQINEFFSHYIVDPFSNELTSKQKFTACIASIVIAVLTLGVAHAVCYVLRNRHIQRMHLNLLNECQKNFQEIKKSNHVFKQLIQGVSPTRPSNLNQQAVGRCLNRFIKNYYAQPLPPYNQITVLIPEELHHKHPELFSKEMCEKVG